MTTAVGNQNRALHRAVTDLTVLYLEHSGFDGVEARAYHPRISDSLDDSSLGGDVRGLSDVHMLVSSRQKLRFDVDLDRVRTGADLAGQSIGALVQWRASRGIDQAYAVVSLADLVKLLGGTPPPS